MKLKPLDEQVIVITGATSGIGLVTARMAAGRGAKVVLMARNEDALNKVVEAIREDGGVATSSSGDVSKETDVLRAAAHAVAEYGNFDTWVNNAGVSIYGYLEDVPLEDSKRLFETNFWGTVNGSIVAMRNLRILGGAIVNVGSTLGDLAIPIQGMYSASKHAVKGFTDALRLEIEAAGYPISVSLVKPAAIDTPYKEHAKNFLGVRPENPPPVYAPEVAARAILHCAEHAMRDIFAGGGGKVFSMLGKHAARVSDVVMESTMTSLQKTDAPPYAHFEGLHSSRDSRVRERGGYEGHVAETSVYTKASMHPVLTGSAIALGVGGLLYAIGRNRSAARHNGTADVALNPS